MATRDSFENLQSRLGMGQLSGFTGPGGGGGYGPSNLISQSGYTLNPISRNRVLLEWAYRGSWVIRNAVDCVADDLTRAGIDMQSAEHPEEIEVLQEGYMRLGIWKSISDVSRWARLYGGALGVLMIDGQDLETPLRPETVGRGQFRGILVLDRWLVQPTLTDLVDEMGPDFGLPSYYDVVADFYPIPNARIHHSRCIRLDGSEIPFWQRIAENMWNVSVLEPLWDRLIAFDSTTQGIAQLAFKAHLRVVRMKDLRNNIAAGGKKLENVVKMMEFIRLNQNNEGITVLDAEDEFAANSYTFAGLSDVLTKFEAQLAGATKIPIVRFFGQSPGGLNATGESDTRNYYDGVHQEQESTLRLPITRINELLHYSELGHAPDPGFSFKFSPMWQLTDLEKGQLTAAVTGAINQTFEQGYVSDQVCLKELRQLSRITNIWSNISDEDIGAAEDKPPLQIQKEMALGPSAGSDYEIRKLENMPHIDIPATPQEQQQLAAMQEKYGVGSKPDRPTPPGAPGAPGGFNPTPDQLLQIGHLHQQHVVSASQAQPQGNGAINPTPEQQQELNSLYQRFATRDGVILTNRFAHAAVINKMAAESRGSFKDYSPDEPRVSKGSPEGGEWTAGELGYANEPVPINPRLKALLMAKYGDMPEEPVDSSWIGVNALVRNRNTGEIGKVIAPPSGDTLLVYLSEPARDITYTPEEDVEHWKKEESAPIHHKEDMERALIMVNNMHEPVSAKALSDLSKNYKTKFATLLKTFATYDEKKDKSATHALEHVLEDASYSVSKSAKAGVAAYTEDRQYALINNVLRNPASATEQQKAYVAPWIVGLEEACEEAKVPKPTQLYRGEAHAEYLFHGITQDNCKQFVGTVITNKSFTSLSPFAEMASKFATMHFNTYAAAHPEHASWFPDELELRESAKKQLSEGDGPIGMTFDVAPGVGCFPGDPTISEVILQHDTTFVVTDIEAFGEVYGKPAYRAEVLVLPPEKIKETRARAKKVKEPTPEPAPAPAPAPAPTTDAAPGNADDAMLRLIANDLRGCDVFYPWENGEE